MIRLCFAAGLIWLAVPHNEALAQLTPEAEANVIQAEILNLLREQEFQAALARLDDLDKLETERPIPLFWTEARLAKEVGQHERAFSALTKFLNDSSDQSSEQYRAALALYPEYKKQNDLSVARRDVVETVRKAQSLFIEGKFQDARHTVNAAVRRHQTVSSVPESNQLNEMLAKIDAEISTRSRSAVPKFERMMKFTAIPGGETTICMRKGKYWPYDSERVWNAGSETCTCGESSGVIAVPQYQLQTREVSGAQIQLYFDATGDFELKELASERFDWADASQPAKLNYSGTWLAPMLFGRLVQWLNEYSVHEYRFPRTTELLHAAESGKRTRYPWGDTYRKGRGDCLTYACRLNVNDTDLPSDANGVFGLFSGGSEIAQIDGNEAGYQSFLLSDTNDPSRRRDKTRDLNFLREDIVIWKEQGDSRKEIAEKESFVLRKYSLDHEQNWSCGGPFKGAVSLRLVKVK